MQISKGAELRGRVARGLTLGAISSVLFSCAAADDTRISQWQGSEPHLIVQGSIDGEAVDFRIVGADALDAMKLNCELEWVMPPTEPGGVDPDLTMARHREIKLLAAPVVGDETRFWSMEFKEHDMTADAPGDTVDVIPRSESELPGPNELWVEVEWLDAFDGDETYEAAALSGYLVTQGLEGTPGDGGIVYEDGSSMAAGFLEAQWSARDDLVVSYSVPCGLTDIDVE